MKFFYRILFACFLTVSSHSFALTQDQNTKKIEARIKAKASRIKIVVIDIEGTLVTHQIYTDKAGFKVLFQDKGAILKAKEYPQSLIFCLFSDSPQESLATFASDAGIVYAYDAPSTKSGLIDSYKRKKKELIERIARELNFLSGQEIAYICSYTANDEIISYCGLSICPEDAPDDVKAKCMYVCKKKGGKGAVKEALELIGSAQGKK